MPEPEVPIPDAWGIQNGNRPWNSWGSIRYQQMPYRYGDQGGIEKDAKLQRRIYTPTLMSLDRVLKL